MLPIRNVFITAGLALTLGSGLALAKDTPDVTFNKNGMPQIEFDNGCLMKYDKIGRRTHKGKKCTDSQAHRADRAIEEYQRTHNKHSEHNAPRVVIDKNGQGEVVFKNDCVVHYDSTGRRLRKNDHCSKEQADRADDAMARHRREQGM
jgi:hypothetical protein